MTQIDTVLYALKDKEPHPLKDIALKVSKIVGKPYEKQIYTNTSSFLTMWRRQGYTTSSKRGIHQITQAGIEYLRNKQLIQ